LSGRTDHGDRTRTEERLDRVHGAGPLTQLESLDRLFSERRREGHTNLVRRSVHGDAKAGLAKDRKHPVVVGYDDSAERCDTTVRRNARQFAEQDRRNPSTLISVGDGEADFGRVIVDDEILGVANNASLVSLRGDDAKIATAVDVGLTMGGFGQSFIARQAEEAVPA
jgi:hypothetical protein